MSEFVSADISQISKFEADSQEAVREFKAVKDQFESINTALLLKWSGTGSDKYREKAEHVLENIGGIKDVLDLINNGIVKTIKEQYLALDEELGRFNRNPFSAEYKEE